MKYRTLSSDEIVAVTTLNCCANAILDNLEKLRRRLQSCGLGYLIGLLIGAARIVARVVQSVIDESPDEDQRKMVLIRMSRLQLQFGHVRKHPEELVIMTKADAETLLAPVLDRCDLECPCITLDAEGNPVCDKAAVKACETRKALKRVGLSEVGISMDCPYQMMARREQEASV